MRAFPRACALLTFILFTALGGIIPATAQTAGKTMTTASGLQITDSVVGTGVSPRTGQTCVMHYNRLALCERRQGKKFDSSVDRGQPFEFPIGTGRVIKGWDEGVASREGRRQAHVDHPTCARLRRQRRRRRHSAQRHAGLRRRMLGVK